MFFTLEDYIKIEEYLRLKGKKDTEFENLDAKEIISEDSVAIIHDLQNRKVNIFDLLSSDLTGFFAEERELLDLRIQELDNLIQDFTIEKVGLSDEFGDSQIAAVSQKAVTTAFNKIWEKFELITGESLRGFSLIVTPEYYIGEEGCTININADSTNTVGKFEYIKFYINDELVIEDTNVETLLYTTEITDSVRVKCVAKILGIEYTDLKDITHYNSFFIGAAKNYTSIMNVAHTVTLDNMKASCDIAANNGDRIFVVVGKSLRDWFTRADMNGIEIPFTESEARINGKDYVIFTSRGTYEKGSYNIDINS